MQYNVLLKILSEYKKFQNDVSNMVDYTEKCKDFALKHNLFCDVNGNISYESHGRVFDLYTVWKEKQKEELCRMK